ncbi:RHS repeat-associated core domain-containing protein [Pseudomonas sp. NPDC089547]|uniref:RHS repeat-associated core domain-containing protein n=1 Tax=Pseudomonas sp. NPDC089547 TaxID=3390652 RepID=UPI003CFDA3F9
MSLYTPYGYLAKPTPTVRTLAFNGEHLEEMTQSYLLGNGYRSYQPMLMKFCQPDSLSPFGKGEINAYAYCSCDPINNTDPSGHFIHKLYNAVLKRFKKNTPKPTDAPPPYHSSKSKNSSHQSPPPIIPYSKKLPEGHIRINIQDRKHGRKYPIPPSYQGNTRPDMRLDVEFYSQAPDIHDPYREIPAMELQDSLVSRGFWLPHFKRDRHWKHPENNFAALWGSELLSIRSET